MKLIPIKYVIADKISGEWGDKALDGQGVVVIRTANFLNSGRINFSNLVRREIDQKKVEKKRLISGDIIIEKSGGSPTQPVGRVVIFRSPDNDTYLCNNFTSILRPKKNEVHPEYLFYILHNNHKNGKTLRHQNKTTGIINLKLDSYLDSEIPLPSLSDQIRIAYLLGKVEGLITQRKHHLQQLDDLLKSVFLKMFGSNCQGYDTWPLVEIRDLAAKHKGAMRTGPFGSNLLHSEFTAEGDVAVLGIDNAVQNRFVWGERRFISNLKYQEFERYRIYPGDIIVTIMGTIGRSAVVPNDIPLAINTKHLAAITLNKEIANPLFLSYSIHSSPFILNQFRSKSRGAIMSGLNLGLIKETRLKRPPIELQDEFSKMHAYVDNLRAMYQKSLADLEALYGALSQRAFKGGLDLSCVPLPSIEPEQEKAVVTESVQASAEENLALNLPDTDNQLDARENGEARKALIAQWLEAYRGQLGSTPFSMQRFMVAAQTRLTELYPDNDFELGTNDYEYIKSWVFKAIASGTLIQAFDDAGNRIQLKAVLA